jgi:hypothetical protein
LEKFIHIYYGHKATAPVLAFMRTTQGARRAGVTSDRVPRASLLVLNSDRGDGQHRERYLTYSLKEEKVQVVHCKKAPFDVYIGRPSKWGNPFSIGKDGSRDEVIAKYEAWILTQPDLLSQLHELKGRVLGCWCAPKSCHGSVLVKLAEEVD